MGSKHTPGRLSPLAVARLKRADVEKKVYHADGGGLYLQMSPGGGKSWVFRYKLAGRTREMGLGSLHTLSLAEAREEALGLRKEVLALRKGNTTLDPLTRRRQTQQQARVDAAKSFSFRDCAEAFMAAKAPEWRNPIHARQWPQSLRDYAYPAIGDLPVAAIDTGLIMRVIEPLWQTKTETANRTRSRIEAVLDYARSRGYREGENPARWRGHIQHMLPRRSKVQAVEHFLALPYGQIQTFIVELRRQESVAARALEFLTLTAAWAGEVIGARWGEINVGEKLWSIPASRMKSGKPHAVPLSDAGMAVIEQTGSRNRVGTDRIFPRNTAGDALSPPAMRRVLADIGFADRTSVHGLRSTFSSWAAALSTAPHEVIEMQLAHAVGDAVVRAYQRDALLAKRRALVENWARFCSSRPDEAGEIVPIRHA